MRLVYVVGVPGAGKSSIVRHAVEALYPRARPTTTPFARVDYFGERHGDWLASQLGADHEAFPGTDRLSMAVQPKALLWLDAVKGACPLVIGEGDRLGTLSFLNGARVVADVTLLRVVVPDLVAERRRMERRVRDGSPMDDESLHKYRRWVAGRATKVERLVTAWQDYVEPLDGTDLDGSAARLADVLRGDVPRGTS